VYPYTPGGEYTQEYKERKPRNLAVGGWGETGERFLPGYVVEDREGIPLPALALLELFLACELPVGRQEGQTFFIFFCHTLFYHAGQQLAQARPQHETLTAHADGQ